MSWTCSNQTHRGPELPEAWEVYQFKSPHSRPCVPKYSLWEAAFSPRDASPVGKSTVNYDTNFAACRSCGRGSEFELPSLSQRVLPEFCTSKDAAASARLDTRVVYHPIASLRNDLRLFQLAAKPMSKSCAMTRQGRWTPGTG